MIDAPVFMTIREVAREYKYSERFLRRLEAAGKLPGVYSGKTKLVNVQMLTDYLNLESKRCGREVDK